ncbi:MAG: DUF460 domain-containing protein [Candidatus Micrarchaeota archaeon]
MIVGVDSGTWRAFAILDFDGNLILLKSRKNWTPGDFIQELSDYSPTIIACDRNPAPRKILLLKSVFGARLYKPSKNLSGIQKNFLTRDFHPRNSHERDALASALKAFNTVKNKLESVGKKAGKAGLSEANAKLVKRLVLRGESVQSALKAVA